MGAPYEEGQTLIFTATNDNNTLFTAQPSVDVLSGTLTYESAPNAFGQAVVTVILHDDGGTANGGVDTSPPQTFILTVNGVNDPPTLDPIAPWTIAEDAGPQTVDLTGISAGGGESQTLAVTASSNNLALIPDPTVAYTSPEPTGSLYFTPTANAHGTATLTVTVSDGSLDTQRAFLVTVNSVNDAPVALTDTYSLDEDTVLVVAAPGVLDNDSDVEGTPLTATLSSGVSHGLLSLQPSGSFTYTPAADYFGPDSFAYIASDGELTDTAMVSITVNPVNDPPVAVGDTATVDEGGMVAVLDSGQKSLLFNDSDPEGDTLALDTTPVVSPSHGVVTLTVSGTFTYTHDGSETISDTFTYRVCDDGTPSPACATANVTITVNPVNDPPVAVDDAYDVDEDNVLVVAAPGVLGNDSDVEGTPLAATLSSGVSHGLLSLQPSGSFTYTPAADYFGPDSFAYIASDGELTDTAMVSITVNPVNDPPVAVGDTATVDEGGMVAVLDSGQKSLLFNDSDPEGDTLALDTTPVVSPSHGVVTLTVSGTFTYTHDGSETISDTFTYRVCDDGTPSPACATANVTITVNPVNDPPVAVDDMATVDEGGTVTALDSGETSLLFNDTDPEGDNLALDTTPVVSPSHGVVTLTVSGTFTYTHDGSETISDIFTYRVCDDGTPSACATAVVSITVNPVDDPPVAVDDSATTFRGGTVTVLDSGATSVLANDYDPEGDQLDATQNPITGPTYGTVNLNKNGTFSYTHDGSSTSSDSFVYEVCDKPPHQLCSTATVTITITPFGVRIDGPTSGIRDISYTFTTTVLGPATTPLTYTWQATGQSPVIQASYPATTHVVSFTWTADGVKLITVTVSNTQGIVSDTHTITIGSAMGLLTGGRLAARIYLPLILRPWP